MITDGSHPSHMDPDPAQTPSSTALQSTTQQPWAARFLPLVPPTAQHRNRNAEAHCHRLDRLSLFDRKPRMTHLEQIDYHPIHACLRPPCVAVAYQRRVDWIYSARQAISSLSRIWGGMGAIALPLNDPGAIADELSPLLRAYGCRVIGVCVPPPDQTRPTDPPVEPAVQCGVLICAAVAAGHGRPIVGAKHCARASMNRGDVLREGAGCGPERPALYSSLWVNILLACSIGSSRQSRTPRAAPSWPVLPSRTLG